MKHFPRLLLLTAAAIMVVPAWADDEQSGALKPVGEKLGTVRFPTSCTPAAQRQFERAVALLHSFWFTESSKAFATVAQTDTAVAKPTGPAASNKRPTHLELQHSSAEH